MNWLKLLFTFEGLPFDTILFINTHSLIFNRERDRLSIYINKPLNLINSLRLLFFFIHFKIKYILQKFEDEIVTLNFKRKTFDEGKRTKKKKK